MINKIDNILEYWRINNPIFFNVLLILIFVAIVILIIPLAIIYILFSFLHSYFYTGTINKKVGNKPKWTWV